MIEARPSHTALRAGVRRAAHQTLDDPKVLDDPIALPIIGPNAEEGIRTSSPGRPSKYEFSMRAAFVGRSRYAEDCLACAVERGVAQYVILGAGLDTFAYRNPYPADRLHVFEVDYPSTQAWKRQRLAAAGIAIPDSVTYAPIDFEHQTLAEGLRLAGFDATRPAFFSWLGVTMYLTEEAVFSTFRFIQSLPRGSGVAFDYGVPHTELQTRFAQVVRERMSQRVAQSGEPFVSCFESVSLGERLRALGFRTIESLRPAEVNARYFSNRTDELQVSELCWLMSAEV